MATCPSAITHHTLGIEALDVSEGIAEYQASLGIGVEDLHGLTRHRRDHVPRFCGSAAGHVLRGGNDADDVERQFHQGHRLERSQNARGTAHVVFHFIHFRSGLERNAAGIEGDAFTHQNHRLRSRGATGMAQDDEFRRLVRSAGNREQGVHAELFHVGPVEDVDAETVRFREIGSLFGEMSRRADVARQVAKVLGKFHPGSNRQSFSECCFGTRQLVAAADAEGQFSQRPPHFLLFGFEAIEAVEGFLNDKCGLPDLPGNVALPDVQFGQIDGAVEAAGFVKLPNGGGQRGTVLLFAEFPFLSHPRSPGVSRRLRAGAVCFDTGYIVEQQAAAGLAFHVAATQDVAEKQLCCLVDGFRRDRQLSGLEDADHDTGAALLFRASTFYAKFQNTLLGNFENQ